MCDRHKGYLVHFHVNIFIVCNLFFLSFEFSCYPLWGYSDFMDAAFVPFQNCQDRQNTVFWSFFLPLLLSRSLFLSGSVQFFPYPTAFFTQQITSQSLIISDQRDRADFLLYNICVQSLSSKQNRGAGKEKEADFVWTFIWYMLQQNKGQSSNIPRPGIQTL